MQVKTIARTDLKDTTVWSLHVNNWIGDTPLTQQPVYILVATALGEDVLIHPSGTQEVLRWDADRPLIVAINEHISREA